MGQRTVIQVESFDMLPEGFAALLPPDFCPQTTEEALSDARRYREAGWN